MANLMQSVYTMKNGVCLNLKIKRTARRNFIFRFKSVDTLEISVFKRSTLSDIKTSLERNQSILNTLFEKAQTYFTATTEQAISLPISFYFMGEPHPIIYKPDVSPEFTATQITLPDHLSSDDARKLVASWLYKQAAQNLLPHLQTLGQQISLSPASVKLTKGKSYWGVCSHVNHIRLNWRLISAPLWVQEYVMIHELCHIPHKNHSQAFWQCVHQFFPQTPEARKWLKTHSQTLQQFG